MSFTSLILAALASNAALAADYTVCASGCDFATLQDAVSGANDGDTLELAAETYTGEVHVTKALNIEGPASGFATLDADGDSTALFVRTIGISLSRVILTGADGFAGLRVGRNSSLDADEVYILNNAGTYGGAYVRGDLDATLLVVAGNTSTDVFAGGVNVMAGAQLTVDNGTFMGNVGYNGGAIGNISSDVLITASSFTANEAYLGGAIHNSFGSTEVYDSSFSNNYADSIGGAWSNHNIGGTVTVSGTGYAANSTGSGNYEDCYDVNGGCAQ